MLADPEKKLLLPFQYKTLHQATLLEKMLEETNDFGIADVGPSNVS